MPVTELAHLHLLAPLTPTLLHDLHNAKISMEHSSTHPFHLIQSLTDPQSIYIVGTWPSVSYHMDEWIPSAQNQELLALLQGKVTVRFMFHVDAAGVLVEEEVGGEGGVLVIERFVVRSEKVEGEVDGWFERVKGSVGQLGQGVVGGWKVEKEDGKEEREGFVVVSWWRSCEEWDGYLDSSVGGEYVRMRELVGGSDVVVGRLLDFSEVAHGGK